MNLDRGICFERHKCKGYPTVYHLYDGTFRHYVSEDELIKGIKEEGVIIENLTLTKDGVLRAKGEIKTIEFRTGDINKLKKIIFDGSDNNDIHDKYLKIKIKVRLLCAGDSELRDAKGFNRCLNYLYEVFSLENNIDSGLTQAKLANLAVRNPELKKLTYSQRVMCAMLVSSDGKLDIDRMETEEFIGSAVKMYGKQ